MNKVVAVAKLPCIIHTIHVHRRTSQGLGDCSPPDSGKPIIFRAKAKFFGPTAKNEKKNFFLQKTKFFLSARKSARIPGFLLIITGWGESGKVILQVSIAVFRALPKKFSGKDGSDLLEKIGPYAYVHV